MKNNFQNSGHASWIINITIWTIFLAAIFTIVSQSLLSNIHSVAVSLLLLLVIVFIGIIFDIIGIAVAAAGEKTLHAKAAKRVYGAKNAIQLIRRANKVSSFCCDVVGDICGIVSGGAAALIIIQIMSAGFTIDKVFISIALTSILAGLTVGGKAIGKIIALEKSEEIMMMTSTVITKIEDVLHIRFFTPGKVKKK